MEESRSKHEDGKFFINLLVECESLYEGYWNVLNQYHQKQTMKWMNKSINKRLLFSNHKHALNWIKWKSVFENMFWNNNHLTCLSVRTGRECLADHQWWKQLKNKNIKIWKKKKEKKEKISLMEIRLPSLINTMIIN